MGKGTAFSTKNSEEKLDAFGDVINPKLKAQYGEDKKQIIFWEEANSKSVLSVVPKAMAEQLRLLPLSVLTMSLKQLRGAYEYTWVDEQLRQSFWDEYFITIDNGKTEMRPLAIYSGVCSKEGFYKLIKVQHRLAFIVHPPQPYIYKMRALLELGLERFTEILETPLRDSEGKLNTRLIGEIVKVVSLIDNRVRGAVPQQLQIRQQSLNMNLNQDVTNAAPSSYKEIDQELQSLEKEICKLSGPVVKAELFGSIGGSSEERELVTVGERRGEKEEGVIEVKAEASKLITEQEEY